MKSISADSIFTSRNYRYRLSKAQTLFITGGGVGKVDRDNEEQEDLPEVSNDIPSDYSAASRPRFGN
jgi:hypothetical protein